jgi:hypothetical protein
MDTEMRPIILSEQNTGKVIGNQEQQRLLGVVEVNIHEIVNMIEQNDEDVKILTAILSLDTILDRIEASLAKDRNLRRRSCGRSAGRGRKGGTRMKGLVNKKPYDRFRWPY